MKTSLLMMGLMLPGLALAAEARKGPDWTLETPAAAWQPRDSQGEFVLKDQIWIVGGWFDPAQPNPRDVWKSADGKEWTQVIETAPWEHSDLSVVLPYNDLMWVMGGRKLPGKENSNKVWSSPDGKDWTLVTEHAGWVPRVSPSFEVFKDRIWVMAGTEDFYVDTSATLKNDIWSTTDGKEWKLEVENAPWSKRAHARAIVFDDKLWIMGGGARNMQLTMEEAAPLSDVWCSEDGVNWTQVTAAAPWPARMWFTLSVYRGHMWVMGGWTPDPGNLADVWFSKDGKNWTELKSDKKWDARHEHSALVFKDKLWVAGGYAEELNSQVWSLSLPEGWTGD